MVIAAFIFMGLACAKQGYPPGGAEDKVPPRVTSTIPSAGATNVSRSDPITIEFSESMDAKSVEDNVFIVPIPPVAPEFRWKSRDRVLTIVFPEPLLDDATFVISIGSKARDLRRNELDDSAMLSFSTGDRIENGVIRGKVIPYSFGVDETEQVSGVDVAAFRIDMVKNPDPRDDIPDYVTQSGADGSYEMVGLSSGRYRLFAIGDKDRNGFYSEGYDLIGIAPGDVVLADADSAVVAPDIAVSERDTSAVQLVSIGVPDNRRIELFFDRPVMPGSPVVSVQGLDILGLFIPSGSPSVVSAATSLQERGARYVLSDVSVTDRDGNNFAPPGVSLFFTGTDKPDTSSLAIAEIAPRVLAPGDSEVGIVFNRIIELPDPAGDILPSGLRGEIDVARTAPNAIRLRPIETWPENTAYEIEFDADRLRSIAGNRPDSTAVAAFRVVSADTLGFIEGIVRDLSGISEGLYRLKLRNIDAGTTEDIPVSGETVWKTGAVLPGRYVLRAFHDSDGDGVMSRGSLDPWRPAERVFASPDTIVVVSRWTNGDNTVLFR